MRTLEYAQPTEQMKLTDVMDLDSAASIEINRFLTRELSLVIQDRAELASRFLLDRDKPWLVCQLCGAALLLVRTQHRFFHFRHHPTIEGLIPCDISTKGALSPAQITAIKYNAQKESQAHIRLKGIIRDSLIADLSCGEPQVEKVWKGQAVADRATWRKPDVQVARGNERIAFEVQLSTTFLTEIVGRREFYRANGGSMIWVFQSFDPGATKTAEEDIFFLNNLNVFIVNDQSLARSKASGRMAFDCWYAVNRPWFPRHSPSSGNSVSHTLLETAVRIPRHSDTQPTLIRTPVPRSFGQAVGAQRRRGGIVSLRCPAS
ncbi:DUF6035 family protein, partial [Pseudomonas sp. 1239]|uniref:DUF6035 family protein n=1 Tax=Pseudomonas sp. 1239 TaxID=1985343 RepID=UPI0021152D54